MHDMHALLGIAGDFNKYWQMSVCRHYPEKIYGSNARSISSEVKNGALLKPWLLAGIIALQMTLLDYWKGNTPDIVNIHFYPNVIGTIELHLDQTSE